MEKEIILMEISIQKKLLSDSREIISKSPKGLLFIRERARGTAYYQVYKEKTSSGWKTVHKNISSIGCIKALTDKKVAEQRIIKCKSNLKWEQGGYCLAYGCGICVSTGTSKAK